MANLTIPAMFTKAECVIYSVDQSAGSNQEYWVYTPLETVQGPFYITYRNPDINSSLDITEFVDAGSLYDKVKTYLAELGSYTALSLTFQDSAEDEDAVTTWPCPNTANGGGPDALVKTTTAIGLVVEASALDIEASGSFAAGDVMNEITSEDVNEDSIRCGTSAYLLSIDVGNNTFSISAPSYPEAVDPSAAGDAEPAVADVLAADIFALELNKPVTSGPDWVLSVDSGNILSATLVEYDGIEIGVLNG